MLLPRIKQESIFIPLQAGHEGTLQCQESYVSVRKSSISTLGNEI